MATPDQLSPSLGPVQLAAGHAPPTPPHENALDDIYGSAPSSPTHITNNEILSDLPSRQRALDTDAYREGLGTSKGQFIQEGFDEGYSLGANLGMRVGYILGVLHGIKAALKGKDDQAYKEISGAYEDAQKELALQELFSQTWIDEEGIWKWDVKGQDEDPTFREVAAQHPLVQKWTETVEKLAQTWNLDLRAVEKMHAATEEQS
jgi:hypothetical protein